MGKKYSFNAVLKADVGGFRDTLPLISRTYESSRDIGETFSRSILKDKFEFPYILAAGGGASRVARFNLALDMSEDSTSNAAGTSLTGIRLALKAVAPSSSVLTTLTQDSTNQLAAQIDDQASKLFGTAVKEGIAFDLPMADANSYEIEIFGPTKELNELMDNVDGQSTRLSLGKWKVSLVEPRASIFFDSGCANAAINGCKPEMLASFALAQPHASSVLSFRLVERVGEIGTVRAYLAQQSWWVGELAAAEAELTQPGKFSGRLCRRVRETITDIGLNDLDAKIVATAVGESGAVSSGLRDAIRAHDDCKFK